MTVSRRIQLHHPRNVKLHTHTSWATTPIVTAGKQQAPVGISTHCTSTPRLSSTTNKQRDAVGDPPRLGSHRGEAAVALLPSYLADAREVQLYNADSHPDGALQLGVAESKLLEDWLVPALEKSPASIPADAIYYQPTAGRTDFLTPLARYLEVELLKLDRTIDTAGLIAGAGCNAVLENLCFCLADPGDAVLLPTPYYAAFEFDLVARAGLSVEAVTTEAFHPEVSANGARIDPSIYYPNTAALDAAYERAVANGTPPRVLLISHPMNPLGVSYPPQVVSECIDWCRTRHVHLISDEIYSGSAHGGGFVSALQLAGPELGPYVHWVYALSKDWALSGLRVGVAYTENEAIRMPLQKLNDLCQISSTTQLWTADVLERRILNRDNKRERWTAAFRKVHQDRLRARCDALCAVLDKFDIPYLPPTAGLFVWLDLSRYLKQSEESTDNNERSLYLELVQSYGLLLTPGESMKHERPGFFRCVVAAATNDEFALALERFAKFFADKEDCVAS